ncbi:MAG: cobalamin B12-binding domain-containing protein [Spirochaetota bacterium]|nr:cobalamin B12-binding domain-containing protein [Spirochaetota bacterium]
MTDKRIRVLMAIPGFDGHWRGATVVTRAMRDAGMEVIYMGQQQPDSIANAALSEDVNVVGLSIYAAGHLRLIKKVIEALNESGVNDVLIIVGGIIPQPDIPRLKDMGVGEVFPPGSSLDKIVNYVKENAPNL